MIKSLTLLKMQWYGHAFKKTLYEYSVGLILFCVVLVFGLFNPLLISEPVAAILENNLSLVFGLVYLFLLHLIFMMLFLFQKNLIFSADFERYIKTLSVSQKAHRISSIFVLLVSNNFLWILLLMGSFLALREQSIVMIFCEMLFLVVSLLVMQLSLYEKNYTKLLGMVLCNIIFIAIKAYLPFEIIKMALIFFLSISVIILGLSNVKSFSLGHRLYQVNKLKFITGSVLPVQLAMLRPYAGFLFIKIIMGFVLQGIAILLIMHKENADLVYFALFFNYMTMLVMASFSRYLAIETKKMGSYFQSLSISKCYWFIRNQMLALSFSTAMLLPSVMFAAINSAFSISMILYMLFATMVINMIVYVSHSKQLNNTTLLMVSVVLILYATQLFLM